MMHSQMEMLFISFIALTLSERCLASLIHRMVRTVMLQEAIISSFNWFHINVLCEQKPRGKLAEGVDLTNWIRS